MVTLCTRADLGENLVPLDTNCLDEHECQDIARTLGRFFRSFMDDRPYQTVGILSVRAENLLKRNHAKTIGDVRRLWVQAKSNQGVPQAGDMVCKEWESLLH